jgi:hypothetical protein
MAGLLGARMGVPAGPAEALLPCESVLRRGAASIAGYPNPLPFGTMSPLRWSRCSRFNGFRIRRPWLSFVTIR